MTIKESNIPQFDQRPLIIAGPCSAETRQQVMQTAQSLKAEGVNVFRAGLWKPRTKPGCFEGVGEQAIPWLQEVKSQLGMRVATEVATPAHVEACHKAGIDIVWLGARTTANPFAVQALADALKGTDTVVMVKNPVSPDLELWIGALERLSRAGITRLMAIHRGFYSYDKKLYRNQPEWSIPIELRRRLPQLPIICDPSHIGGARNLIAPLAQQAMDTGFDGLIIESHINPDTALSDASQQITPSQLGHILRHLIIRRPGSESERLREMRVEIDECDSKLIEILSRRMRVSREIGQYKKENSMTIVQPVRYNEILSRRSHHGTLCDMDAGFIQKVFEAIHEESVRQQLKIMNQK